MISIPCPNCGPRNVTEFRYGGERLEPPTSVDRGRSQDVPGEEWRRYVYMRSNTAGPQVEWWFHRQGCRRWFLLRRDTLTNRIDP